MNYLIAYNLRSFEIVDGTWDEEAWKDYGIDTTVITEVSSQAEALRRFLKKYEDDARREVQVVSITKLEEETDKMLMAWCYNHWASWSDYSKEEK